MTYSTDTFRLNTLENILTQVEAKFNQDKHHLVFIYRKTYLGGIIHTNVWSSNNEEDFNEVFENILPELIDYNESCAVFLDGVMLDEKNGCTLFTRNCRDCKHKTPIKLDDEGKPLEYECDIFKCSPDLVTYICFNHEKKEKVK